MKLSFDTLVQDAFSLSVRTKNCLKNAHIDTIGELATTKKDVLIGKRLFGKRSFLELEEKMSELDLHFGMSRLELEKLGIGENANIPVSLKHMTLRDYFAGQALIGFMVSYETNDFTGKLPMYTENGGAKNLAEYSYNVADAMLAERTEQ